MVVFTGPDKALLDRAARMFDQQAAALNWEAISDPKKRKAAKDVFDRHKRDAFDLRALGVRLKKVAKVIANERVASQATASAVLDRVNDQTWPGADDVGARVPHFVGAGSAGG